MAKFDSKMYPQVEKNSNRNDLLFYLLSFSLSNSWCIYRTVLSGLSFYHSNLVLPPINDVKHSHVIWMGPSKSHGKENERMNKIDLLCLMAYWIFQYTLRTIPFSTTDTYPHAILTTANPAAQHIQTETYAQFYNAYTQFWLEIMFFFLCVKQANTFAGFIASRSCFAVVHFKRRFDFLLNW